MDYNFGEPFLARLVSKDENTFAKIMELMEKEKYSFLEVMYLAVGILHFLFYGQPNDINKLIEILNALKSNK